MNSLLTSIYTEFPVGAWDLTSFLTNAYKQVGEWGKLLLMLLGIILIVVSGVKIWRNFTSESAQRQPRWGMTICGLLVGGALSISSGWTLLNDIAQGGQKTIQDLGGGAIVFSNIVAHPAEAIRALISF